METQRPDSARTLEAWRRVASTGELVSELLRESIYRAWKRCQAAGTSPHTMIAKRLDPVALEALLERERDLIEAAKPYMHALSRAAGSELHAAMLADADGVVLDLVGHREHIEREGFPLPGSKLSEDLAGANGIGTSLAEGGYVELVGPEHFIEGFHIYTCQGVPIHAPEGQRIVGVLSLSVRRLEAAERVREILVCAAHGIEAELTRRRLEADLGRLLEEEHALEQLRQDVMQLHAAARLRLDHAARIATREDASHLAISAADLARRFRVRSELWRDLAFEDHGAPRPLELQQRLGELVELLGTEASTRGVRLVVAPHEPLRVSADARALSRELFRVITRALGDAARGDVIELALASPTAVTVTNGRKTAGVRLKSLEPS